MRAKKWDARYRAAKFLRRHRALVGAALLALTACGGGDNNTPPLTGGVRVGNGITDSTGLDMSITNVTTFSGIGVDTASGINYVPISAVVSYEAARQHSGLHRQGQRLRPDALAA